MTTLEIILSGIVWVAYGAFAAYQTEVKDNDNIALGYFFYIVFSPLIFIAKALYGAFKKYE